MITLTGGQIALLTAGALVRRLFLTIDTTDASGGGAATVRFWDGLGSIVVSGDTFSPLGGMPEMSKVSQVLDGSIPGVMFTVSGVPGTPLADLVNDESRRWHQRPCVIWLGLFDPATAALEGGLIALQRGFLDKATFLEDEVGGASSLQIAIESSAREMTRSNPAVRSHLDQLDRFPNDFGFEFVGRDFPLEWGVLQKHGRHPERRHGKGKRGGR
jgi:hypothetical protein